MTIMIRTRGWLAAGLLLLAGCRSEQAAFEFRPAALPTAAAAAAVAPAASVAPAPGLSPAPAALPGPARPADRPAPARQTAALLRLHQGLRTRPEASAAPRHAVRHQQARRPHRAQVEHTKAFILGILLVAGGVVLGIALGGWLGLGAGALTVLLGYYFLGVGIGGKHAWLEVFQEFFNM